MGRKRAALNDHQNMPAGKRKRTDNSQPSQAKAKSAKKETTTTTTTTTNGVFHISHGKQKGCVFTLGEGDTGQLGLGPDVMERSKPALVELPSAVVQVCAGGMHTVCLTTEGQVFTWGCNDEGALGRPTPEEDDTMVPGKTELKERIVQVSAGDSHTAALTTDGNVLGWGTFRDANGSIGLRADGKKCLAPTALLCDCRVVKIASGVDHLACLTEEGLVYTFGAAEQGQLGRVAECFSLRGGRKGVGLLLNPAMVHCRRRKERFDDIWTGQYSTFVKARGSGSIYSWGLNNYFQLGFADMQNRFMPELCRSLGEPGWAQISAGQHHAVALDSKGNVLSFGRGEYGRLGHADEKERDKPTLVQSLKGKTCSMVNCGTAVSFTVTDKGELYAWGMGTTQQLGQSDTEDLLQPTLMTGKQLKDKKVLMANAGGQHTVLLAQ